LFVFLVSFELRATGIVTIPQKTHLVSVVAHTLSH